MSVVSADSSAALPHLRVLPARTSEPRYDDELPTGDAHPPTPGQAALSLPLPLPNDGIATRPRNGLRLVRGQLDDPRGREHGPARPDSSVAAQPMPAPRLWAARLVQALCEALAGDRPVAQLSGHLTSEVYAAVESQAGRQPAGGVGRRRSMPTVRSIHVCQPAAGVAEVSAVVSRPERVTALALRLERQGTRWLCTALQTG